jgi:hypothetical protein
LLTVQSLPMLLILARFAISALSEPVEVISLSNSLSFFFDRLLNGDESMKFTLSPDQPFSIFFHKTDKFQIILMCRTSDTVLTPVLYSDANISRFLSFDSTYSVEAFTITPLTPQRFSFSFFAFYPRASIFITNRASVRFSFWDSFSRFKCSRIASICVILNITHPYVLSSERSVEVLSSNKSHQLHSVPFSFDHPSLLQFKGLTCQDNFSFWIESDSDSGEDDFAISIPDRYDIPLEGSKPSNPVQNDREARDAHILLGVSAILVALGLIAGVIASRGLFRCHDRRSPPRKAQIVPEVTEPEAAEPGPLYLPPQFSARAELDESSQSCVGARADEIIEDSDPYQFSAHAVNANQEWTGPIEGDSPYDLAPTDC